jgi:hypothetical protein
MRGILISAFAVVSASTASATEGFRFFHTPSKNIYCAAIESDQGNAVDCIILEMNNSEPALPRPADCDLDWGQRFAVGETGEGEMGCAGDTVQDPSARLLPYGKSLDIPGISCASSEKGLECKNKEGHGFFLSRAKQRVF